jgi:threonine/homoserine/homoserine lactone efflux protein
MQTMVVLSILGALALGVVSPGPSFVFVARTAAAVSRRDGLAAAFGMGVGAVIFAVMALLGLQVVIARIGWLSVGLRVLGGLYLIHLAIGLWRGARQPLALADPTDGHAASVLGSFGRGLGAQVSNPKAAIVYGGVFAALLPASVPADMLVALPPLIFLVETAWYSVVAVLFSTGRPRAAYVRSNIWIDRIAGAVIGALGARLVADAVRPV